MLTVPRIVLWRQKRAEKKRRQPGGKVGLGFSLLLSILLAVSAFALTFVYAEVTSNLPSVDNIPRLLEPPDGKLLQPTRIYDRTGQHILLTLANPAAPSREYLSLEQISPSLIDAVLASADPEFEDHPGFLLEGLFHDGQQTLAERLAGELLLNGEETGLQKTLRVKLLAAQMTHKYGRERVLEWYLNSAQFGPLVFGAGSASQVYFGKEAADLTLPEAAALAASATLPQVMPSEAPSVIIERQRQILGEMLVQGRITPEETIEASQETISFLPPVDAPENPAPEFTAMVLESLSENFSRSEIERGGLIVITSLDYDLQREVNCAASTQLHRINNGSGESLPGPDTCQAARLLPTMTGTPDLTGQRFGFRAVVLEPNTGQVLALASGGEEEIQAPQDAGTLITPVIYLAGFTHGLGPATLLWDVPGDPEPGPAAGETYHGPVRLRTALANDYLVPAVQVLTQIGIENTVRTARQMGMTSLNPAGLEQMLAAHEDAGFATPDARGAEAVQISLMEAAQAFGVLASQGSLSGAVTEETAGANPIRPVIVLRIDTHQGETLYDCGENRVSCRVETRPVVSAELAYLVNNVLSDENARWASLGHPNFLEIGRPVGAKLGVVDGKNSGWTVGYTPQRVVAVWIGSENQEAPYLKDSVYGSFAVRVSASLWHALIQYASREQPAAGWNVPAGITQVEVCDPSGMLPTPFCPTTVREVFLMGSEPTQPDNLFRSYQINRETSRLATVFTPPELVEERVYMVVPSEAAGWATAAGVATPPDLYDVIYTSPSPDPHANITSPALFGYVRGKVNIRGTAAGEDFDFYRLQAGKGLNPKEWVQIGGDIETPVKAGLLGIWDTEGLSGLYALELLIVRSDQSVSTTIVQVTIDNQAPQPKILQPADGQVYRMETSPSIVLQAEAADDLGLEKVEYYIDNELVGTILQEPSFISWRATPGSHEFRARAYDMAGNTEDASIRFSVED